MVKRRAWRCPLWECSKKGAGGWRVRLGVNASSYHTVLCMHLPTSFRIYNGKGNENITLFCIDVLHVRIGFGTNDGSEENTACYREKDCVESICSKSVGLHLGAGKLQEVFGREGIYLRGEGFEC